MAKIKDHRGVYGAVPMLRLHGAERIKYPPEKEACEHMRDPDAPKFVPAPVGPLRVWCCGCRSLRPAEAFHRHKNRATGYQSFCKTCQKAHRKAKRLKTVDAGHWYRGEKQT